MACVAAPRCILHTNQTCNWNGTMAGRLWTTLPTSLISCPVISISWDPFGRNWLSSDLQQMPTFSFLTASLGTIGYTFIQGIMNKELIPEYIKSSAYSILNHLVLLCSGLIECSFLLCLSAEWQYKLLAYVTRGIKMLLSNMHIHFCVSFKEDEVDMNSFVNNFKFLSFTAEVQVLHSTCLWWFCNATFCLRCLDDYRMDGSTVPTFSSVSTDHIFLGFLSKSNQLYLILIRLCLCWEVHSEILPSTF